MPLQINPKLVEAICKDPPRIKTVIEGVGQRLREAAEDLGLSPKIGGEEALAFTDHIYNVKRSASMVLTLIQKGWLDREGSEEIAQVIRRRQLTHALPEKRFHRDMKSPLLIPHKERAFGIHLANHLRCIAWKALLDRYHYPWYIFERGATDEQEAQRLSQREEFFAKLKEECTTSPDSLKILVNNALSENGVPLEQNGSSSLATRACRQLA